MRVIKLTLTFSHEVFSGKPSHISVNSLPAFILSVIDMISLHDHSVLICWSDEALAHPTLIISDFIHLTAAVESGPGPLSVNTGIKGEAQRHQTQHQISADRCCIHIARQYRHKIIASCLKKQKQTR